MKRRFHIYDEKSKKDIYSRRHTITMCGLFAEEVHCSFAGTERDFDMICKRCLKSFQKAVNEELKRREDEKLNGEKVREADASALKPK